MDDRALDSTDVSVPRTKAPAEGDRSASEAGRRKRRFGVGAVVAAGFGAVILYGATLSGGQKDVETEDKSALTAPNMEGAAVKDVVSDQAAQLAKNDEQPSDDPAQGDADDAKLDADLRKMREQRLAGEAAARRQAEAERQRKLAEALAARQAREKAPVMVLSSNGPSAAAGARATATGRPVSDSAGQGDGGQGEGRKGLAASLKTDEIARVSASRMPNRNFTIEAGTQIPCTLQTALDSTLSGLVSCVIPYDVRSATGQVVLLEKGTRVLGEYQGGIQQGEARVFVVWSRAVSPGGIAVNLASPAADSLGRSGVPGDVENFFWKRYGAALLLSLVGDASTAATGAISGVQQTLTAPKAAANDALRSDTQIKPVLRAPQGSSLVIFAARDLDFSSVYSLRLKR